ncbi:MAG: GNAT family N-acetyltransferase, partial [Desulforhopalus sp.]
MMKKATQTAEMTVTRTTFADLFTLWAEYGDRWQWNNPFVTPPWLKSWWRHFADDNQLLLLLVSEGKRPVGVAPLMVKNNTCRLIGSIDLCDYGDFIAVPGSRESFCREILRFLASCGIRRLILEQIRPDSLVYSRFIPIARLAGWRITVVSQGASVQMNLPTSWEEYLQGLGSKQRHEVRRKMRRAN